MTAGSFKVPYGLDETGALIPVAQALTGHKYTCPAPQCGERLILRQGRKILKSGRTKATHFAHKASAHCAPDRVTHGAAQREVAEAVWRWKKGLTSAPLIVFTCSLCGQSVEWPLPDEIQEAVLEYRVSKEGKDYKVDIALLPHNVNKFAVEVHLTNYVEEGKEADLTTLGITYFEVEAREVLNDSTRWRMINSHPDFKICSKCAAAEIERERQRVVAEEKRKREEKYEASRRAWEEQERLEQEERNRVFQEKCREAAPRFKIEAQALAKRINERLSKNIYRYMISTCWRCQERILVYTWPGKRKWDWEAPFRKFQSMPSTIRRVLNKKTRLYYWANTCFFCGAVQGDEYLDFPINPIGTSTEEFEEDIGVIAYYYYNPPKGLF